MPNVNKIIAKTFADIADGLETGSFKPKPKILLSVLNGEHGDGEIVRGALNAKHADIVVIGKNIYDGVQSVYAGDETEARDIMERMLDSGEANGAVTAHYPFPVGVSTVGRVITPGVGRTMYVAATTGAAAINRVECMVKNAIYGIITAKTCGVKNPTIGILNLDGARQAEMALKELKSNGYAIHFAKSGRADGGAIMRGNDVLTGACDVMIADPLTGNVIMKMLSSFTTGGKFESVGHGYGPGVGKGYKRLVLILSRASGAPVVAGALEFAAELVNGGFFTAAEAEFLAAEKAGLNEIIANIKRKSAPDGAAQTAAPPKEAVAGEITGVEITDLDDARAALWKAGMYAESGMGCTGPVILVSETNLDKAVKILTGGGWIAR